MGPLPPHRQLRSLGALAVGVLAACSGERRPAPAAPPSTPSTPTVDVSTACAALRPAPSNPVLGAFPRAAEPLVGTDVDGRTFELAAQRGKVVLVSFTSTWDMLTKEERPTFAALRDAVGDDLVIVRVVSSETLADVQSDRVAGEGYPTVFDQERSCSPLGALTSRWGVNAVPESFLVDREGNVRFYFVNKRDWSTPEAVACVRALLADTTPAIAAPPVGATAPSGCGPASSSPGIPATGDVEVARGTISFAPAMKRGARPGRVFVVARHVDDAGQPTAPPLGVALVDYTGGAMEFVIVQMLAGVAIEGDIVIDARWDQDGDAMTRQPGDITGAARAVAPARDVALVLDSVLP